MATTSTTNINLAKPDYSENADVQVLNQNADKIDAAVGGLQNGFAIIVDGDAAGAAVAPGAYAYIKNNTHGLAEGLYKNKSSSAFPVSGGTANSTVFEAVSGGLGSEVESLNGNLNNKENKSTIIAENTIVTTTAANIYAKAEKTITIPSNAIYGLFAYQEYSSNFPTGVLIGFDGNSAIGVETTGKMVSLTGYNYSSSPLTIYVWAKQAGIGTNEIYIRGWYHN